MLGISCRLSYIIKVWSLFRRVNINEMISEEEANNQKRLEKMSVNSPVDVPNVLIPSDVDQRFVLQTDCVLKHQ